MGPNKSAKPLGNDSKSAFSGPVTSATTRYSSSSSRTTRPAGNNDPITVTFPLIGQRQMNFSSNINSLRQLILGSKADDHLVNVWAGKVAYAFGYGHSSWAKHIPKAKAKILGDTELVKAFEVEAAKTDLITADLLKQICAIESGGDRAAQNGSYWGLFQLGQDAAQDVGIEFTELQGKDNWKKNVEGGRKFLNIQAKRLKKEGLECSACHIYLLHQQGMTGGLRVLKQVASETSRETLAPENLKSNMYGYSTGKSVYQKKYKQQVIEILEAGLHRKMTTSLEPSVEEYYMYLAGIWDMVRDVFAS